MRVGVFIFCLIFSLTSQSAELRIATAANFYPTLNKIKTEFENQSEHRLSIIRGSTGKLYAQIIQGAPFDVFLSADSQRAELLVKKGKSLDGKAYAYATGEIVLWRPDADSSQQLREQLMNGDFQKLAIANPKTAPYGKAAIEVLRSLELYNEVKHKLVYGENVSQTLQFIQSGAAGLGFVARSLVNDDIYWEGEEGSHFPITQKMLGLKNTKNQSAVKEFIEFMQSNEANLIIARDGYK